MGPEKQKCPEPGCVNGKITLFTSVKVCSRCGGEGYILQVATSTGEEEPDISKFTHASYGEWDSYWGDMDDTL